MCCTRTHLFQFLRLPKQTDVLLCSGTLRHAGQGFIGVASRLQRDASAFGTCTIQLVLQPGSHHAFNNSRGCAAAGSLKLQQGPQKPWLTCQLSSAGARPPGASWLLSTWLLCTSRIPCMLRICWLEELSFTTGREAWEAVLLRA